MGTTNERYFELCSTIFRHSGYLYTDKSGSRGVGVGKCQVCYLGSGPFKYSWHCTDIPRSGSDKLLRLLRKSFESFEQLGKLCPRLCEDEKLIDDSVRVGDALSDFYAVVVVFCTKALGVIQNKGIEECMHGLGY